MLQYWPRYFVENLVGALPSINVFSSYQSSAPRPPKRWPYSVCLCWREHGEEFLVEWVMCKGYNESCVKVIQWLMFKGHNGSCVMVIMSHVCRSKRVVGDGHNESCVAFPQWLVCKCHNKPCVKVTMSHVWRSHWVMCEGHGDLEHILCFKFTSSSMRKYIKEKVKYGNRRDTLSVRLSITYTMYWSNNNPL